MKLRTESLLRLGLVGLLSALAACASDDPVTPEVTGPTAASLLRTAWTEYEAGDYAGALAAFDQTLTVAADTGEAHLGRGWCLLKTAGAPGDLTQALAAFDRAMLGDATNHDALAGRSATGLGIGGASLSEAIADAGTVLQQDPAYAFSHDMTFNSSALRLIQAQSHVAGADYAAALLALDLVYVSGISAANPATWVVDGLIEASFEATVIAHLGRMDELLAHGRL